MEDMNINERLRTDTSYFSDYYNRYNYIAKFGKFLIQKIFFHDNPTWNLNYSEYQVGIPSRYSEYLLRIPTLICIYIKFEKWVKWHKY